MKPVVAIAGQLDYADAAGVKTRYLDYLHSAGLAAVIIPPEETLDSFKQLASSFHGIVLPGGCDVNPALYGERPLDSKRLLVPLRDTFESQLIAFALENNIPLLGLCRGIQIMNIALGGTLYQKISTQKQGAHTHWNEGSMDYLAHDVSVEKGGLLDNLGCKSVFPVNSIHEQGIKILASSLRIEAISDDGIVEAVSYPGVDFALAVQWHPEAIPNDSLSQAIIYAFKDACVAEG